jgi:uncharacterized membrane protein YjjB (DUF3815 family)
VTFNTGDCLIEVTAWAGSTVFATALFFSLLSVERVKVYHWSVFVVAIGYIVNYWILIFFSIFKCHGRVSE